MYATVEDFADYVEGWSTDDDEALERLLTRASRDIDSFAGRRRVQSDTGFKFITAFPASGETDPTYLDEFETWQVDALKRATCAQAEYRLAQGEDFMVNAQPDGISGPDISTSGRLPYMAPKAWAELQITGILRLTMSGTGRGSNPPWHSFAYNDDDC